MPLNKVVVARWRYVSGMRSAAKDLILWRHLLLIILS